MQCQVFNVGEYRRKMTGSETVMADFFHPANDEARRIRELAYLLCYIYCSLLCILCNSICWLNIYLYLISVSQICVEALGVTGGVVLLSAAD